MTAQIIRDDKGQLQRVASWDSAGSELLPYEPDSARPAARSASAESSEAATIPSGAPVAEGPAVKVRRIGTKEVVYTRLSPAPSRNMPLPQDA
jgi:hypothetical protein